MMEQDSLSSGYQRYPIFLPKFTFIMLYICVFISLLTLVISSYFYLPLLESIGVSLFFIIVIFIVLIFQNYLLGNYFLTDIIIDDTKIILKVVSPFRKEIIIDIDSIVKVEVSKGAGYFPFNAFDFMIITRDSKLFFAYLPSDILNKLKSDTNIIFEGEYAYHQSFLFFRNKMRKKHSIK